MLLSHKYRFIFIKTYKTAGTSIEVDLAPLLGLKDVVTPVFPRVDGHQARNHRGGSWIARKLGLQYSNHMTARQVRRLVGRRVFDSYFKFCVEREPVAKCVSQFLMYQNSPAHRGEGRFDSWDDYVAKGQFPENASFWLDDDDRLLVDRILPFEELNAQLASLYRDLGIPLQGLKAQAKSGWRSPVEVTEAQRQIIYTAFSRSLPFTGYRL